jgi:hypothetical protein
MTVYTPIRAPAPAPARHGDLERPTASPATAKQTCGAQTRAGHPCKSRVLWKSGRCKHHGGLSTGPKTAEGKQRIAEAQRKRWAMWRVRVRENLTKLNIESFE